MEAYRRSCPYNWCSAGTVFHLMNLLLTMKETDNNSYVDIISRPMIFAWSIEAWNFHVGLQFKNCSNDGMLYFMTQLCLGLLLLPWEIFILKSLSLFKPKLYSARQKKNFLGQLNQCVTFPHFQFKVFSDLDLYFITTNHLSFARLHHPLLTQWLNYLKRTLRCSFLLELLSVFSHTGVWWNSTIYFLIKQVSENFEYDQ